MSNLLTYFVVYHTQSSNISQAIISFIPKISQITDPENLLLVDEKIKIVDSPKIKSIPLAIAVHGVHEMCFKYQGHHGKFLIFIIL